MPRIRYSTPHKTTRSDETMMHRLREQHRLTVATGTHLSGDSKSVAAANAEVLSWAITKIEGAKQ